MLFYAIILNSIAICILGFVLLVHSGIFQDVQGILEEQGQMFRILIDSLQEF